MRYSMNGQEAIKRVEEQVAQAKYFQVLLEPQQTEADTKEALKGIEAMEIVLAIAKEHVV